VNRKKNRRRDSALDRLTFQIETYQKKGLFQFGGLNPTQMADFQRMQKEAYRLTQRIGG
jgi:hypothetical protein